MMRCRLWVQTILDASTSSISDRRRRHVGIRHRAGAGSAHGDGARDADDARAWQLQKAYQEKLIDYHLPTLWSLLYISTPVNLRLYLYLYISTTYIYICSPSLAYIHIYKKNVSIYIYRYERRLVFYTS